MFRFEDPWVLALLAIVPLTYWLRGRGAHRTGALRFSALDTIRETGVGISNWLPRVPSVFGAVGVVAVIVALARPQTGVTSETLLTQGIDIVMVMDVSSSMLAEDLEPNRLEAAKAVAADFVGGRRNDRIALVAFAGQAFTQAPLTLDYRAAGRHHRGWDRRGNGPRHRGEAATGLRRRVQSRHPAHRWA